MNSQDNESGSNMIETEKRNCNLCGCDDATVLFEAVDRLHPIEGKFTYVRCNNCQLLYMNPQVTASDIAKLYPADYAPHVTRKKKSSSSTLSLKDSLARIPVLKQILACLLNVKIARSIARTITAKSRVLDIGCGSGGFLHNLRKQTGCQVYGVDISQAAVDRAKESFDLDIFHGTIAQAPYDDACFDLATAWWYLEHEPDPNTTIARMSAMLKDNAFAIIGIPNHNSLLAKTFKDKWYHLDCPRHLCIYTPDAIKRLLKTYGLTVRKIVYDKTPWGLLGSLQYRFYGDNINARHRNKIRQSLILWVIMLPLTICLALLRKSDIMVVYAQKDSAAD